jgi:hypothetical protein
MSIRMGSLSDLKILAISNDCCMEERLCLVCAPIQRKGIIDDRRSVGNAPRLGLSALESFQILKSEQMFTLQAAAL